MSMKLLSFLAPELTGADRHDDYPLELRTSVGMPPMYRMQQLLHGLDERLSLKPEGAQFSAEDLAYRQALTQTRNALASIIKGRE